MSKTNRKYQHHPEFAKLMQMRDEIVATKSTAWQRKRLEDKHSRSEFQAEMERLKVNPRQQPLWK